MPGLEDLRGKAGSLRFHIAHHTSGRGRRTCRGCIACDGQAAEGTPVVHVRGFPYPLREGSLKELIRPKDQDLFR